MNAREKKYMKNDISKSICKALIFTVLPFAIPLIFEIIPNTFITNCRQDNNCIAIICN